MSMDGGRWGWLFVLCCVGGIVAGFRGAVAWPDSIRVGGFSERTPQQGIPEDWRPYSLANVYDKTDYELVRTDRGGAVRARSDGEGSALVTRRRIDLTQHPVLKWHWKVDGIIPSANARIAAQSDYPASLFVTFDYKEVGLYRRLKILTLEMLGYDSIPTRALVYTWTNRVERAAVFPNPKAEWMKMIAVRSGTTHVGTWKTERRNVRADYRDVFGDEPPPVKRIALMTSTNDTKERITAYYGDVTFQTAVPDSGAAEAFVPPGTVPSPR